MMRISSAKRLVMAAVGALGVGVLSQSGSSGQSAAGLGAAASPAPRLVAPRPHVNLGVVREGSKYDFNYLVRNEGEADLEISRIRSTCGCTVTEPKEPQRIPPGQELIISANFDARDRFGHKSYEIEVHSNDPAGPVVHLTFEAVVEALYQLSPNVRWVKFQNKRRGEALDRPLAVLAGKVNTDIEILHARFDKGGVTHRSESIEERGYRGHRLHFVLDEDVPIGEYESTLRIKVRSDGEEGEIAVPFSGSVISDIEVRPAYLIAVAPVLPGDVVPHGVVTLRAINRDVPFQILRVRTGAELSYEVEQLQPGLEYGVTIRVAESARKGPAADTATIFTDSREQPVIRIPVFVQVGSPVEVSPEIPFLRRLPGDDSRATQTVTLHKGFDDQFRVTGVSSDNPNFVVRMVEQDEGILDQKLVVTLADGAAPGMHEGTITVHSNPTGGRELTIDVYGEVVVEPSLEAAQRRP